MDPVQNVNIKKGIYTQYNKRDSPHHDGVVDIDFLDPIHILRMTTTTMTIFYCNIHCKKSYNTPSNEHCFSFYFSLCIYSYFFIEEGWGVMYHIPTPVKTHNSTTYYGEYHDNRVQPRPHLYASAKEAHFPAVGSLFTTTLYGSNVRVDCFFCSK
jgi:hypothetical protein